MRDLFLAGLAVLCAGCWSQRSSKIGPDTWSIECKRSRKSCYREAANRCPNGFTVLDGDSQSGVYVNSNTNAYGQTTAVAVPTYYGEMLVRCDRVREADPYAIGGE